MRSFHNLKKTILDKTKNDEMIFMPSSSGAFQTRRYIETIRHPRHVLSWTALVWNKLLPNRINGFMWRVFLSELPVDEQVRK